MDSGYFFKLRDEGNLLDKQILFSYTRIKSASKPEYPVFLVFNMERIDFFFHGQIFNTKEKRIKENIPKYEFVENHLFSLNLHKGKENVAKLNNSFKELFNLKFPVIADLKILNAKENRQGNSHITYTDLKTFENKGEHKTQNKSDQNITLFYRELLLDFLFDVYHSNVFENSPVFTTIKQHLEEIPFIQAIKRKAEFYYQVENIKTEIDDKKLITFDTTNSYYIVSLIKAQKNWLEMLQAEDSYQFINEENRWFDDVETEVRKVLKKQVIQKLSVSKNQASIVHSNEKESSFEQLVNHKEISSQWFIKRNNIIDAWKSAFDTYKLNISIDFFKLLGTVIPLAFLLEIINIIFNIEGLTLIHYDLNWWILVALLSIFIVLLLSFIYLPYLTKQNSKQFKLNHLVRLFYDLALIPFLILILTSSFVISELTSLDNHYFVLTNDFSVIYGILSALFLILILASVILYLRKKIKWLEDTMHLSFIIILSFIFVPTVFYFIFHLVFWIEIPVFIIGFIIVWILYIDERKSYPKLASSTSWNKILSMLVVGLAFSFFSNLLILHFTYKDYLDKFSLVDEIWKSALYPNESSFDTTFRFNASNVPSEELKSIRAVLEMPVSPKKMAEKEEYFYTPLEKLTIYKNGQEIYPVVKTLYIHGLKIITMPMVLIINTFLTLLLAVLIQVVLNHRKFLEGGKA